MTGWSQVTQSLRLTLLCPSGAEECEEAWAGTGAEPCFLQEKVAKMKAAEAKLESDKRRLKEVLDASESRSIKLELQRRALEGELQRSRLGLGDREAHAQALQDRVDSLQRQVRPSPSWSHLHGPCQALSRHCATPSQACEGLFSPSGVRGGQVEFQSGDVLACHIGRLTQLWTG